MKGRTRNSSRHLSLNTTEMLFFLLVLPKSKVTFFLWARGIVVGHAGRHPVLSDCVRVVRNQELPISY